MTGITFFLSGAITAQFFIAALFFLRYAKKTTDNFFRCFGAAFTILGVERITWVITGSASELQPIVYLFRLSAFVLIIAAVLLKNRGSAAGESDV